MPAFNLRLAVLLFLAVAAFTLVACGGDDDDDDSSSSSSAASSSGASSSSSAAPTTAPADESVEGTVSIEGSSTVQPFTLELIPAFEEAYPDVTVNPPSGLGSGAGISAFINKEVDIAQASRAIKDDEIQQAKDGGQDPYETRIFNDALAVVVHPDNPVSELTEEQVAKIFAGEITSWDELGGSGDITVYTRNEESGTFAYMEEDVIQKVLGKEAGYAADVNKQASAPAGLSAVSGDPKGIFYAGLGNLAEIPAGSVKVLMIEGATPSAATVKDGTYPIARGLFYYTDGDPMSTDNKAVAAFIEFALSPAGQKIGEELGFLPVGPTE
jgi:phosphate transport system substrate-binding protein